MMRSIPRAAAVATGLAVALAAAAAPASASVDSGDRHGPKSGSHHGKGKTKHHKKQRHHRNEAKARAARAVDNRVLFLQRLAHRESEAGLTAPNLAAIHSATGKALTAVKTDRTLVDDAQGQRRLHALVTAAGHATQVAVWQFRMIRVIDRAEGSLGDVVDEAAAVAGDLDLAIDEDVDVSGADAAIADLETQLGDAADACTSATVTTLAVTPTSTGKHLRAARRAVRSDLRTAAGAIHRANHDISTIEDVLGL